MSDSTKRGGEIVSQRVVYEPQLGEVGDQPVITAESLAV